MTEYKRIGIDTSKSVFTLHGIDASDQPTLRRNVSRAGLLAFFRELLPTEIVMEACGAAYHWARELTAFGHGVRLIPPRYVKTSGPGQAISLSPLMEIASLRSQ